MITREELSNGGFLRYGENSKVIYQDEHKLIIQHESDEDISTTTYRNIPELKRVIKSNIEFNKRKI